MRIYCEGDHCPKGEYGDGSILCGDSICVWPFSVITVFWVYSLRSRQSARLLQQHLRLIWDQFMVVTHLWANHTFILARSKHLISVSDQSLKIIYY